MSGECSVAAASDTGAMSTSTPSFDDVLNFREMGGLPAAGGTVKSGHLFRSGHWSTASDADVARLAEFGLASIVDFRAAVDRQGDGGANRIPDGPDYLEMEMIDSSGRGHEIRSVLIQGDQQVIDDTFGGGKAEAMAREGVVQMALEAEKQAVFAGFLDVVAEPSRRPVLWHCSAGKDRAGWAATLVGMALGVPDDALVEHYLESNVHRPVEQRVAHYEAKGLDVTAMVPFMRVDESYIRAGFDAIDQRWSSREAYLAEALGFGPERIAALRADLVV